MKRYKGTPMKKRLTLRIKPSNAWLESYANNSRNKPKNEKRDMLIRAAYLELPYHHIEQSDEVTQKNRRSRIKQLAREYKLSVMRIQQIVKGVDDERAKPRRARTTKITENEGDL